VVVVEEVVLSHSLHVGVDSLTNLAAELCKGGALPLRCGLHNLSDDRFVQPEARGELHGGARTITVEHVVDTACPRAKSASMVSMGVSAEV